MKVRRCIASLRLPTGAAQHSFTRANTTMPNCLIFSFNNFAYQRRIFIWVLGSGSHAEQTAGVMVAG